MVISPDFGGKVTQGAAIAKARRRRLSQGGPN